MIIRTMTDKMMVAMAMATGEAEVETVMLDTIEIAHLRQRICDESPTDK